MTRSGSLYLMAVILSVVMSGCSTTRTMETAQSLSKGQTSVFGRVNVIVDGKHAKRSFLGGSTLIIEFRRKGSSSIMEHKLGETGHFYWALAPGEYEILGTYGHESVGFFESMIPLAQRVGIEFAVQPGVESLYIGDLTLEVGKDRGIKQRLDDNYSDATKEFHKKYPNARAKPLKQVTKLAPPEPGTYAKVMHICSRNWGINCSSQNAGVTPTSPDRLQDVVVESTAPNLRWVPVSIPYVKYDVAIYDAYDSSWNKIGFDVLLNRKRWRKGRLLAYAQGLAKPAFKPNVSLQPDTTYLWSVRLRRGDTVSTWSQVKHIQPYVSSVTSGFVFFGASQYETWLNFTTPSK